MQSAAPLQFGVRGDSISDSSSFSRAKKTLFRVLVPVISPCRNIEFVWVVLAVLWNPLACEGNFFSLHPTRLHNFIEYQ